MERLRLPYQLIVCGVNEQDSLGNRLADISSD